MSILLYPLNPIKVKASVMSCDFTCLSKILELLNDGRQLTSKTHDFRS